MALGVTQARPSVLSPTISASPPTLGPTVQATPPRLTTASVPPPAAAPRTPAASNPPSIAGPDYTALLRQAISNQQAVAPKLDYAAISSQARNSAQNAVNPFYTKSLNDFLTQQATVKAQQQAATDTAIKGYEDTLGNTLQQNTVAGQRATEDANTNIGQINTAADQLQTDSGSAYDAQRIADAKAIAASGSSGGFGAQILEAGQSANATAESRAGTQTQEQIQSQQLSKARTFEDLAKVGEMATQSKEKNVTAAKVDLANFIENQGFDIQSETQKLEQQRLQAVASEQQNQSKLLLNQFLSKISNPAQYQAAVNAYGGIF